MKISYIKVVDYNAPRVIDMNTISRAISGYRVSAAIKNNIAWDDIDASGVRIVHHICTEHIIPGWRNRGAGADSLRAHFTW